MSSTTIPEASEVSGTPPPPSIDQPPVSEAQQAEAQAEDTAASGDAPPKTTPITKEAKEAIKTYLVSENWSLNRALPRGNKLDAQLKQIMGLYKLNRSQLRRQLNNYKRDTFGYATIKLTLSTDDIKEQIREGLGMDSIEFVDGVLQKILDGSSTSSFSSGFDNFMVVLDDFPPHTKTILSLIVDEKSDSLQCTLLARCVDYWIVNAAEEFPKTIARISGAELEFQKKNTTNKRSFITEWNDQYDSFVIKKEDMSKEKFTYFGSWLIDMIYVAWAYSAFDNEKPAVSFPDSCLVGKYARSVIYYVAGWTLFSASKALTIAKEKRGIYTRFASNHCLEEDEATQRELPVSLVQRRKRRAKLFCTKEYFEFVCYVESVYLLNLDLDMMKAYADGDIIYVIKMAILESETARDKFMAVCNNADNDEVFSEDEAKQLMKYIMERYANMRGSYFVKHLNGTGNGGSAVDKQVNSLATRTKVVAAAASSKAAAEASKKKAKVDIDAEEETMWGDVGESVLEKSEELDNLECRE